MAKLNPRVQRLGYLIRTALAEILQRSAEDLEFGMVTITNVTVSPDLSFAKVFVSVLDDANAKTTLTRLNDHAKQLRYELAHAVKIRTTPELKFVYDDSIVRGNRISSLINDVMKKTSLDDQ